MAGIDTGAEHGGKKSVNQEIPLVPFIDFLLCCVMFLLVTAVWNQLSRVESRTRSETIPPAVEEPPVARRLRVGPGGYELHLGAEPPETIARTGDRYDVARLATRLASLQREDVNRHDLVLEATDDVKFVDIIDAMDVTAGAGLLDFSVSPMLSVNR